jgi:putative molybdopterin biosynthesis protein
MSNDAHGAIVPAIRWMAEGKAIDPHLLPLLRAVGKTGSLNKAVATLGISYRHAWGMVGKMERALGRSLVAMERGRGARLSPFAEKLLEADDVATRVIGRELASTVRELGRATPLTLDTPRGMPLVIHASHDYALSELRDRLLARGSPAELHFRGSLECLASLARRECDVAGFHVPEARIDSSELAPYRPLLSSRGLRLVRFVSRRQGLIVGQGNPKSLLGLTDLARKDVRFVNRQPQSGTRLCFDRLLAEAGVDPAAIRGYRTEEFTHAAVAATIASGMADAGFGIEAAARQHGLDFITLATERYFLAARAATLGRPGVSTLLEEMKRPAFLKRVAALPGYEEQGMGEIVSVREALRAD